MQYALLKGGCGILLTRGAQLLEGDLELYFEGAHEGAVAIFESGEDSIYRTLYDAVCTIPREKIREGFGVTVILYDGTLNPPRWSCEGIKFLHTPSGEIIACPAECDVFSEISSLRLSEHKLTEEIEDLKKKICELNNAFISMMEGYDLT